MSGTHPQACVPSRKIRRKNCEIPSPARTPSRSRALGPVLSHKTHAKRKNQPFPARGLTVTPVCRTLNQRRSSLWVGGRAECEPRATPLSTRSILAVYRSFGSPFFSFSFVPHGRPPPFPTVCDFRIFVFIFSSFTPCSPKKNTFQKL